jgi:hypothetical protein
MKVVNQPDFPFEDAACKAATGKTIGEWYSEFDAMDALAKGRRETTNHVYNQNKDAWWATTLTVEYEKHKGQTKKDGLPEGYSICCTKTISAPVAQTLAEGGEIACQSGCKGAFSRIRPNKDLRFSWEHPGCSAPMTVDVQFQNNKGKTLMNVMTSRIQTRAEADGLRNAWSEALTRLKSLAEG